MNVQGRFNEGRGASGLNGVNTLYRPTSRHGTSTPRGTRPPRISGKRRPIKNDPRARVFVPPNKRPSAATQVRHRQQFINWLKRWAPQVYADAKKRADVAVRGSTLNGLGGWWDSFTESVGSLGGKYLQFRTQKDILNAQMARMEQGLPPLQTSEYAPTIAIKPDAGTTRAITGAIGAGFGKFIPWVAAGVGAYLILRRKRR